MSSANGSKNLVIAYVGVNSITATRDGFTNLFTKGRYKRRIHISELEDHITRYCNKEIAWTQHKDDVSWDPTETADHASTESQSNDWVVVDSFTAHLKNGNPITVIAVRKTGNDIPQFRTDDKRTIAASKLKDPSQVTDMLL